ncbi:MAG: DUF6445 family protein [Pseudomonadota bacterium]
MILVPHPGLAVQKLTIGRECAPLLVIDNLVAGAEGLVDLAAGKLFGDVTSYYPGIRAKAPLSYQQFVLEQMRSLFSETFGLQGKALRFTACYFSLVTTPPEKLSHLQCIPHIDSVLGTELAFVHYLFKRDHGGTAFYRHRSTGFEVITQERKIQYFETVEAEKTGANKPAVGYIGGSTALYEQLRSEAGVFNRMLVYRRNSLHSGSIATGTAVDPNPRSGRLSINGFMA